MTTPEIRDALGLIGDLERDAGALSAMGMHWWAATMRSAAKRIKALEAALGPAAASPCAWHPIDSAPKNGTWVIAAGGGADFGMPMKWSQSVGAWECDACMLEDWDNQAEGYSRPTHWMPLPSAPLGAGGEG